MGSIFKRILPAVAGTVIGGPVGGIAGFTGGWKGAALGSLPGLAGSAGIGLGSLGTIGKAAGNIGNILGAVNSATNILGGQQEQDTSGQVQTPAFNPTRPGAMGRPASLANLGGFTPEQERSALATKGINSGLGDEENSYYRNLVARSLIGDNNQIAGDTNSLLPVESQFFARQGYNTSDPRELLRALMSQGA